MGVCMCLVFRCVVCGFFLCLFILFVLLFICSVGCVCCYYFYYYYYYLFIFFGGGGIVVVVVVCVCGACVVWFDVSWRVVVFVHVYCGVVKHLFI